jgi:polyhydroxyalkanoate synthase subunit PhaC
MSNDPLSPEGAALASNDGASQHGDRPRPLPLFLHMLRSEAAGDPALIADVLAGVRRYQQAPRAAANRCGREVARVGRATLLDFGGSGVPVVFVPSLINGSEILDLDADRSLLRWLAREGLRPLLVDWGSPDASEATLDIGGHVETLLDPLLERLGEPAVLVGYCLGGTMAIAAAALRRPRGLGLIAAPWDYRGFPDNSREALAALWAEVEAPAAALGLLPMDVLQLVFWRLDPARTLAKFAAFGRRKEDAAARTFVAMEDWANAGPPMTYAAARQLMESFFAHNAPAEKAWRVGGKLVDPVAIDVPALEIVSTTDRIVPAAAAARIGQRLPLALGHVGMIVGGRAQASVWEPLRDWLLTL